ncbi:YigZ family protein [Trichococcus alkaliphilus]|uniref:YigZ family protein n=1 Tax=Trichococcus alkaliphilus TaxID=2052943 RepID=UPI000D0AE8E6|nr:YigZ family protein [Trichococcus alkaliphilus]
MLTTYHTIAESGVTEIIIKGSRFICSLKRVHSEDEAKAFIQAVKKEHWKATHNCSAYLIGDQNEIQRAHDDGEPSGTAGVPMLEVLKKNDLRYVAAVVTRYFGGTKLGAGGLIRAYSRSVSTALKDIGIVVRSLQTKVGCIVSYSASGKLENYLAQSPYTLIEAQYTDQVCFLCGIPTEDISRFQNAVTDVMNGRVVFEIGEEDYVERPVSPAYDEADEGEIE